MAINLSAARAAVVSRSSFTGTGIRRRLPVLLFTACTLPLSFIPLAGAQTGSEARALEEVVVTARKRREAGAAVPLSLTVYDAQRARDLKIRDLTRLTTDAPGVLLDDVGTRRGTANFSIRGLGINSSIPSIEPTVGVFVNGVYLGINNDVIFDLFDIERIEVLRGPQGVLYGRNVTGGAVLVGTQAPTDREEAAVRIAAEGRARGGKSFITEAALSGAVTETLAGRLALYRNDDSGYFQNRFDGRDHGALEQRAARLSLRWTPLSSASLLLQYERGDLDGDGPAVQSHENGAGVPGSPLSFDRDSLDFSIDEPGYQHVDYDFLTLSIDADTAYGQWTNIFGVRDQSSEAMSDIDGQPVFLFHSPGWIDYRQWSNELRFSTQLSEATNILSGVYVFSSDLAYHDRRLFLGDGGPRERAQVTQDGGGIQTTKTLAAFGSVEHALTPRWNVEAGLRVSSEEKSVRVASFNLNTNAPCNIVVAGDCPFDFADTLHSDTVAPSISLRWTPPGDSSTAWLGWSRSYRSGGYNLRNSNAAEDPGPVDEETVDGFEVGFRHAGMNWNLSATAFYTRVQDMQREVNLASESAGILQLVRNTASAALSGVEASADWQVTDALRMMVNIALLDARYRDVIFDLNGDGVVDARDRDLELPRAPDLTWGFSADYQLPGSLPFSPRLRLSYSYRDRVAYTDNNLGFILEQRILDADLRLHSEDRRWTFSAYGRNLLDSVKHGGDSQLPAVFFGQPLGGTFAPLSRGMILGVELAYAFD